MDTGMGPLSREQFGPEMGVTRELHTFLLVCVSSPVHILVLCFLVVIVLVH